MAYLQAGSSKNIVPQFLFRQLPDGTDGAEYWKTGA